MMSADVTTSPVIIITQGLEMSRVLPAAAARSSNVWWGHQPTKIDCRAQQLPLLHVTKFCCRGVPFLLHVVHGCAGEQQITFQLP